jgi:RNA polymerase sigma-70 factor (ECF subfamily)
MNPSDYKTESMKITSQLEKLIDSHQDKLVHHAYFRLGSRKDAEDVVQDVFVKIFSELNKGKNIADFNAFSFRMVANACTDKQRAGNRFSWVPFETAQNMSTQTSESREEELIREEDFRRINFLLESIPEEQAEILRFRFVDGLHFQQIADILELPLTTTKSRFSYGLQKIKTQFFNQKEASHAV